MIKVKVVKKINRSRKHVPMYKQISSDIRMKIIKGTYKPDVKLQTEDEIAYQYGVSRMTARNAISELVEEGLVYRVHGRGTFVKHNKIERSLNKITGFYEDMTSIGLTPSSKIISSTERLPTTHECESLNIQKNDKVLEVKRIRYVDSEPYGYQKVILSLSAINQSGPLNLRENSLYAYLKKIQKPILTADQHMEAIMNIKINKLIEIPVTIPLFYFKRTSYIEGNIPVELLYSYFRGDKFSYSIKLSD